MPPTASTSNPPLLRIPFGLPPCFPPLQRPIRHSRESILDFLRAFHRFNVQSAAPVIPFWTFSVLPAASTSNPPLFLTPFGLPPCFPPLQRPICRSFSSLLDFLRVSLCFNVQSAAPYSSLLDFLRASRRFNVQSAALSYSFWTSSLPPAASTSNLPLFTHPFWTSSVSPTASKSNPPLLR